MKTPYWLPCVAILTFSVGLTGCDNDTDEATDSFPTASFTSQSFSFDETAGEQLIALRLNRPAHSDGELIVNVQFQGDAPVQTLPAMNQGSIQLQVREGQSTFNIRVIPIDNEKLDGTRNVRFTLLSVEDYYRAGLQAKATVTIADDESPARVEFPLGEATLFENGTDGYQLEMRLSSAAPAAGIVILETVTECRYSTDFLTVPSAVNGKLYLPVAEGQTSVSVKVYPLNDAVRRADREITFSIADASGGVMQDGYTGTFRLLILEDDSNATLLPRIPNAAGVR